MRTTTYIAAALGCTLAMLAAGCERQAAKPARTDGAVAQAGSDDTGRGSGRSGGDSDTGSSRVARDDGPTYKDGKPTWASNRKHTSQENIEYQFNKNGAAFKASSADDYVAKVHAFLSDPPKGVDSVTRARNGDKLYYDAKSNTMVVATRDGAPRTMFKPTGDGEAYWAEQKANASEPRGSGRRGGNRDGDNGGGASNDNG
jgi:hypothetical protein